METFDEIREAVDNGAVVCWKNDCYRLIKDSIGQYLISYLDQNWVGLHEPSYDPADFYIKSEE